MKAVLRWILPVALWITMSTVAWADLRSVKVPTANFRAGPSTSDDIKFKGAKYFPVKILKEQGDWVQVKDFEGEKAWVAARLLSKDVAAVIINVKTANVRGGPGTNHDVVFKVERGEVFKVVKREGNWLSLVDINGEKGWIREDLVWGMKQP